MNPEEHYRKKLIEVQSRISGLERKVNLISLLRLGAFLLSVFIIYLALRYRNEWIFVPSLLCFIGFLVFVKMHVKNKAILDYEKSLEKVYQNEIAMLQGQLSILDNGNSYENHDGYAADLDLFGDASMFHRLSRTHSQAGKDRLANQLQHPFSANEEISMHQKSVAELQRDPEFREQFLARLLLLHEISNPVTKLRRWNESENIGTTFLRIISFVLPVIAIGTWIFCYTKGNYQPAIIITIINLSVAGNFAKKINRSHSGIGGMKKTLDGYSELWKLVESKTFQEKLNTDIRSKIHEASDASAALASLSEQFDRRLNPVIFVLFNGLFLYDLHIMFSLEKWSEKYKSRFELWFEAISEMEALCSFATWNYNHPDFIVPVPQQEKTIVAKNIAHPLLPQNKRIGNDFILGKTEKIALITGSNMSGKSTFLRSVGINLILARCGANVCANEFVFYPFPLFTSLRQSDSLRENISLFHAELLRLKYIQDEIAKHEISLVLIDEMLRGTNSEDKLNGSRKLIEKLKELSCIGLIATHDLALGDMESIYPGKISNYCFESRIENEELLFDFTLRKGIAKNKNATFLLKKMNIID